MTGLELKQRLLRIQIDLERYDQHHEDCRCSFCEAIVEIALIRYALDRQEAIT